VSLIRYAINAVIPINAVNGVKGVMETARSGWPFHCPDSRQNDPAEGYRRGFSPRTRNLLDWCLY